MRDLKIAYGNSRQAKFWSNKTITFEDLCERLKTPNRPERTGIQFVWIGLLIDMIFEVLLGTGATWICLLLINHL